MSAPPKIQNPLTVTEADFAPPGLFRLSEIPPNRQNALILISTFSGTIRSAPPNRQKRLISPPSEKSVSDHAARRQKQVNADERDDDVADLVAARENADGARNDQEQSPPAVKRNVSLNDAELL